MVKLRRLKIERYRNVEPCDLTFGEGLNVVLGQNGAGKTTLLNLISRVLRTNLTDTSDPFAVEIEVAFPGGSLSGRIATREPEAAQRGPEGLGTPAALRAARTGDATRMLVPDFRVVLRLTGSNRDIEFRRNQTAVVWEELSGDRSFNGSAQIEAFGVRGLIVQIVQLGSSLLEGAFLGILQATQHVVRFDEGLDIYRVVTAKAEDIGASGPDLAPRWFVSIPSETGEVLFSGSTGLTPDKLETERIKEAAAANVASAVVPDKDVAFLAKTVRLLNLQFAEARLELLEKDAASGTDFFTFGNLRFWFTRRDGSIFQDHQLSYGQKRLLTFFYYLDANPSFVIADELVNGMHHLWIEECVDAIGDRQAFLTSQNPLLLDYLTFDSAEQVRSSFVVCQTELRDGRERMIWRNFTDDEADMFYNAYRVGIEHVGEILRTRGLW